MSHIISRIRAYAQLYLEGRIERKKEIGDMEGVEHFKKELQEVDAYLSEGGLNLNNQHALVIDELNKRIEDAEDNEEVEVAATLKSFYDWYVEQFIEG